ncbi:phosphate ABC transporter substrate-binding protein [Metabacillus sp. RGM 3146]|uniref:phosphate ABC transporter substrate-binding protein n=1 Tax=Metabacillus sp. RGM 3146 TaxID=3401092 RepID=UPI003B993C6E
MKFFKNLPIVMASAILLGTALTQTPAEVNAAPLTGTVTVSGSSAIHPLTVEAGKQFKAKNPGVTVTSTATNSLKGAQAVSNGTVKIGASDWDNSKSVPGFTAIKGLVPHPIAVIPFATIANNNVKVSNLTTKQLQDIFAGRVKNWNQVGGQNAPIVVINRASGSGTRVNFQSKLLKGASIAKIGKEVASGGDMATAVSKTPNAIGYIDLAKVTSAMKTEKYNGVAPTTANVINKTYPGWAYGFYLTKGTATGATKSFIDYVRSSQFQTTTVKKMGFIPLTSMK